MEKRKLTDNWKFCKGCVSSLNLLAMKGIQPQAVDLPHDAMIYEKRSRDTKNGSQTGFYPGGMYTYFKQLDVPSDWQDKTVILEFEGVYETAMVYVNGALAATNLYGYSGFFVQIDDYLHFGETNEIKVIADNSSEENTRWYSGSGIYRNVNLYVSGKTYILPEGVEVKTNSINVNSAEIEIKTDVVIGENIEDPLSLNIKIKEAGKLVYEGSVGLDTLNHKGTITQKVTVADPLLWDIRHPNLYEADLMILCGSAVLDHTIEHFGIRTIKVDAKRGFLLNGESVNLRGTCLHHDNGIIGAATFEDAERRKVRLLKEAGFNSIRSAHHPISKEMLDVCDELGMLVMDELFDMWTVHKNNKDFALHFLNEWESVTEGMVKKDRNHPSVIMYSIGNEIPELGTPQGVKISRMLCNKLHSLDDTRYTTCGVNGLNAAGKRLFEIMRDVAPLLQGPDTEEKSQDDDGRSMGSNALNSIMEFMTGKAGDAFATHPKLTEAIAGVSDATDIIGLNYMTGRHVLEAQLHPNKTVVGTETFPADIFRLWSLVEDYPHIIGDFTWTGYDYLGEAGCGIFYYDGNKNFGSTYPDRLAYIGDITITGIRRPISYYREIVYGLRKQPYIAVDRVNHNGEKASRTPWMFKDNISSWTWKSYENSIANVDVYSNAEEVELFLNDRSLGRKCNGKENAYIVSYEVPYEKGRLVAIDYVNGIERGRYEIQSAGEVCCIKAETDRDALKPNGQDLCFISVEMVDKDGNWNMQEEREITVSVEGAGILQGIGSSNPSNEDIYCSNKCTTYDGNALVCIRAGHNEGMITVKISASGCEEQIGNIRVGGK